MTLKNGDDELALEITVLSAESLKNNSGRLRPYVTLSPYTQTSCCTQLYRTRAASGAHSSSPTWNDTFRLPLDPTSFLLRRDDSASVHVSVLSNRKGLPLLGPAELGWCLVRPSDVVDGLRPPGAPRRISYALRSGQHGGRGRGVVHLSVRLVGPALDRLMGPRHSPPPPPLDHHHQIHQGWAGLVAIGVPVGPGFQAPDYWA